MSIEIIDMKLKDVLYICENMRKSDWIEVTNTLPRAINTPELIAMTAMQVSKLGFVAKLNNEPVMVAQFAEILDGSWRIGLFGTNKFNQVCLTMVKELISNVVPYMIENGVVYCDAHADNEHKDAHRLLEFVGFEKKTILKGYGSRGRDIALFVLTKEKANVLRSGRWRRFK